MRPITFMSLAATMALVSLTACKTSGVPMQAATMNATDPAVVVIYVSGVV